MTVMRWFRRHNKKLMVGIVFFLMLAFGLPTVFFTMSGRRNPDEYILAYITDLKGGKQGITQGMLRRAERDIQALQALGVGEIFRNGQYGRIPGLQGVAMPPVMATYMLFFGNNYVNLYYRDMLYQVAEQSDWTDDEEMLGGIKESIDRLASCDASLAPRYFVLLSEEARRAGMTATVEQISAVYNMRPYRVSIGAIAKKLRITEGELKAAVGNYLAILLSSNMVTRPLALSEAELKRDIRDQIEKENVTGSFVTFGAGLFRDQIADPNDDVLQRHFATYKQYQAGKISDENPYGFGYMLGDRVQVEYLKVDLEQAHQVVEAEFNALSALEREEKSREFWSEHKEMFREPIEKQGGDNTPQEYRYLGFDEVADQAETAWKLQEAYSRAEKKIAEAKRLSQSAWSESNFKELSGQERAARASDYAELVGKVLIDPLIIMTAGKSEYLDAEAAEQSELGSAYLERKGGVRRALMDILFDCAPLHKGTVSTLDEPPMELYDDIGPIAAAEAGPSGAVYLVRIVAVDAAREPVSLADDGCGGPADQAVTNLEESILYEKVKEDWKLLQAFELTRKQAEIFARQADPNWSAALAQTNQSLIEDPNLYPPGEGPLRMNTLAAIRQRRDNFIQFMGNIRDPQTANNVSYQIMLMDNLLQKAMELARRRDAEGQEGRAVLVREDELSCLVFKELMVTPPTQQEYLRHKPLAAVQTVSRNQMLLTLIHFDPTNIERRSGFEEKRD